MSKVKRRRISHDMGKVKKILDDLPEDRQSLARIIYSELSFIEKTMTGLKEQVEKEGAVDLFEQGSQKFYREHPALQAYTKLIPRYSQLFKQLVDLMPDDEADEKDDLMEFVNDQ